MVLSVEAVNATQHETKGKSGMAADVSKQLERAKKFLEKNRVEDAIEAYLGVLEGAPQHLEASQALGDLYTRVEQPERAAVYYGHLFDLLIDPKDETKALAIYNRFLRNALATQAPERIARYAFLLATPIIFAAAVLKIPELTLSGEPLSLAPFAVGAVASAAGAYVSVRYLTVYFKTRTLIPFAWYCLAAGLFAVAFSVLRGH